MTIVEEIDVDDNATVQSYPADVSYQKLKNSAANYSILYRFWVDVIYFVRYSNFWFSVLIYRLLTVYVLFFTNYWYVALLYALWIYYDRETPRNGGRKIKSWKSSIISKYMRDYYPVGLVKTCDFPCDKNYMLAAFPHGILSSHVCINFIHDTDKFSQLYPNMDLYTGTLDSNFYCPILRDDMLFTGMVSVSEKSLMNVLTRKPNSGTVCVLVVGGAAESFYAEEYKLVLKNRKGFVRIALQTGAALVPVYGFGENHLYEIAKYDWLTKCQTYAYKLIKVAPLIPWGRSYGPVKTVFPKSSPLITVVGKPIDLPKIENPTKDEINHYHRIFSDELMALFERYKEKYDPLGKNAKLTYV